MSQRSLIGGLLIAAAGGVQADSGLVAPSAEQLWPQWQARVTLQAGSLSPLAAAQWLDAGLPQQRGVQGGAVFGDYVFARPSFGSFRASGGLLMGAQGGLPLGSFNAGSRIGLALTSGAAGATGTSDSTTLPYLGLGYSGAPWRGALAITADVGMVAERPGGGLGRALFGNQGFDGTLREIRLSPLLQLGVRYTF